MHKALLIVTYLQCGEGAQRRTLVCIYAEMSCRWAVTGAWRVYRQLLAALSLLLPEYQRLSDQQPSRDGGHPKQCDGKQPGHWRSSEKVVLSEWSTLCMHTCVEVNKKKKFNSAIAAETLNHPLEETKQLSNCISLPTVTVQHPTFSWGDHASWRDTTPTSTCTQLSAWSGGRHPPKWYLPLSFFLPTLLPPHTAGLTHAHLNHTWMVPVYTRLTLTTLEYIRKPLTHMWWCGGRRGGQWNAIQHKHPLVGQALWARQQDS